MRSDKLKIGRHCLIVLWRGGTATIQPKLSNTGNHIKSWLPHMTIPVTLIANTGISVQQRAGLDCNTVDDEHQAAYVVLHSCCSNQLG